ncbi:hypothetical protein ACQKWADRAFT_287921 [Trichoderma austrokoningii]
MATAKRQGGEQIAVDDLDSAEQRVLQDLITWLIGNPNADWHATMFSPHVEQCIGGGVEDMARPLESKYPGFDWVICRTRLPSLPTRTAGIWIPIAGFDGCRIEDEAGFTYELLVGKKYRMLEPTRRVTLRVGEGGVMHVLWLMKRKEK